METMERRTCLCALNRLFGYEPILGQRLLERFGGPEAVFAQRAETLREALGGREDLIRGLGPDSLTWAAGELERVEAAGGRFIGLGEEDYPALLAETPDPPLGLYLLSRTLPERLFQAREAVAFVGTRDASPYGREWCAALVRTLADTRHPPVVVSGLAFGIDRIAHETALACGLPTIGVMATGITQIYPWQHRELARKMVTTPGCGLITDYPTGTSPVALNFIRRNRIIAGLCRAVVVIESKTKGGSLITAKYANDYDRDVYALPGRVDDLRSQGCNSLLRQRMADIITTADDLVVRLGLKPARSARITDSVTRATRLYGPDAPETRLVRLLRENRDATREELATLAGWPLSEVLRLTTTLECDGLLATDLLGRYSFLP